MKFIKISMIITVLSTSIFIQGFGLGFKHFSQDPFLEQNLNKQFYYCYEKTKKNNKIIVALTPNSMSDFIKTYNLDNESTCKSSTDYELSPHINKYKQLISNHNHNYYRASLFLGIVTVATTVGSCYVQDPKTASNLSKVACGSFLGFLPAAWYANKERNISCEKASEHIWRWPRDSNYQSKNRSSVA